MRLSLFLFAVLLASTAHAEPILLPRLKPAMDFGAMVAPQTAAPLRRISFPGGTGGYSRSQVMKARQACMEKLKGADMTFEALPPLGQSGGCGTAAPLLISAIAGVRINPPAEANCDMAEALHAWISWSVKPAAKKHLGKTLTQINNASAYACRRRNNARSGKMSEHAYANALDISTLVFSDGSETNIKGDWKGLRQMVGLSGKGAFLRTIRQYACIRFSTVLGPGSDRYHGDHFHVDLAKRRSGYRVCK